MEPTPQNKFDSESYLQDYLDTLISRIASQCEMMGLGRVHHAMRDGAAPAGSREKITPVPAEVKLLSAPEPHPEQFFKLLEEVANNLPHYFAGMDAEGRVVFSNRAFARFLADAGIAPEGLAFDELIIHTISGGRPPLSEIFMRTAATGLWSEEIRIGNPDGAQETVFATLFAFSPSEQLHLKYAAILIDVSRQKEITNDLIQNEVMRSIGMLAGGVAHHLNNLLVGVLGYASLLKPPLKEDPKLTKYLSMIENAASKAADLTKQLLSFSQRGESTPIDLDLKDALKIALSLVRKLINSSIEIKIDYPEEQFLIHADPAHIEHIIIELCVNASNAMPEGGMLTISARPLQIREHDTQHPALKRGSYVSLRVRDTGIGISPEQLKDIFQPFYTTREFAARGLGLSAVYGLIQRYKGVIHVESRVGLGTTVEILLPRVSGQQTAAPAAHAERLAPGTRKTKTLLIVDDEELVLDFFASVLENEDFAMLFAKDGVQALEIFKRRHAEIDLVFMDMIMPRKNGVETYHEMAKLKPELKVILTSGYTVNQDLTQLLEEGKVDFIRKPFDIKQFMNKIHAALNDA